MKIYRIIAIAGCLCLLPLTACHNHEDHEHEEHAGELSAETHSEDLENHNESNEIVLSSAKAKAAGLACETIQAGPFFGIIETSGEITEASCDEHNMVANISGTVSFVNHLTEGVKVSKGQTLCIISEKNFQDGNTLERARLEYENARAQYERAEKSVQDKIISEKEFQSIKTNYETAKLAYEAIPQNGSGNAVIKAPADGYVKKCAVKGGDYVSVGQVLVSITQNKHLYLKADLPERYFGIIKNISSAKFRTSYSDVIYDISKMDGKLLAYGKNYDTSSAYIPITFEFSNNDDIAAGSYAEVFLITKQRDNVISVPVSAITEEQGVYFAYLQKDSSCYAKQEVALGETDGERIEIKSGLKNGDKVVTQGVMHVKLAGAENAIPAHTHSH